MNQLSTLENLKLVGWFLACALVFPASAQAFGPERGQFQVNSYTTGFQSYPEVATAANGDFVVVWYSEGSSGTDDFGPSIQGQRYDSTGRKIPDSEFQVNTGTGSTQLWPSVGIDADGDFVVAWTTFGSPSDGDSTAVKAQRFDSTGIAVGSEFQVNTYTYLGQSFPSVSLDADGDIVIVWTSSDGAGDDNSSVSVQGQRYNSAGVAVGDEFQVNTYIDNRQDSPDVSSDLDGDFVVVWEHAGTTGGEDTNASIQGQRYNSSGAKLGSEFQVNTYGTGGQWRPKVSLAPNGDFVVVWESNGSNGNDSDLHSIQGQRYASSGETLGSEFQVNTYTTYNQKRPSVSVGADGDFVVVWDSMGSYGTDTLGVSVLAQRYNSSGATVGSEFQVNSYTDDYQLAPSVSFSSAGDFVVVWQAYKSFANDNDSSSIQAQRYSLYPSVPVMSITIRYALIGLLIALPLALRLRRCR